MLISALDRAHLTLFPRLPFIH